MFYYFITSYFTDEGCLSKCHKIAKYNQYTPCITNPEVDGKFDLEIIKKK